MQGLCYKLPICHFIWHFCTATAKHLQQYKPMLFRTPQCFETKQAACTFWSVSLAWNMFPYVKMSSRHIIPLNTGESYHDPNMSGSTKPTKFNLTRTVTSDSPWHRHCILFTLQCKQTFGKILTPHFKFSCIHMNVNITHPHKKQSSD